MENLSLRERMEQQTVKQLREEAKERGIPRYTCLRKPEIIEALLKSEAPTNIKRADEVPPTRQPRKVELLIPKGKKLVPIKKQQLVPIKKKVIPPRKKLNLI